MDTYLASCSRITALIFSNSRSNFALSGDLSFFLSSSTSRWAAGVNDLRIKWTITRCLAKIFEITHSLCLTKHTYLLGHMSSSLPSSSHSPRSVMTLYKSIKPLSRYKSKQNLENFSNMSHFSSKIPQHLQLTWKSESNFFQQSAHGIEGKICSV